MSMTPGSLENARSRAIKKHASRPDGSLPCTLQLAKTVGDADICAAVANGVGYPMMIRLISFPNTVLPIVTTRTRSLASSSRWVHSISLAYDVHAVAWEVSNSVKNSEGPNEGSVSPKTAAEKGCGVVPNLARTRHWNRSPGS